MSESLYELLAPHLASYPDVRQPGQSEVVNKYLNRLATLPLSALSTTEPQSLHQSSHINLLSLQTLASRSHKSATATASYLSTLNESLPAAISSVAELRNAIPQLDQQAVDFSTSYSKSRDNNPVLDRRKHAMLLSGQVDKISEILELPSLLATAIASAGSGATSGSNYSQALDLFAHIKRLQILHPNSIVIKSVIREAEEAMRDMITNLVIGLRGQNIRLAAAIRAIGFLRRVAPELGDVTPATIPAAPLTGASSATSGKLQEGLFGSLFLTARLANLLDMLEALAPLRDLADQETNRRLPQKSKLQEPLQRTSTGTGHVVQGQQTERYLKRYIEIFREQSFATVSMYRNIYPVAESKMSSKELSAPSSDWTLTLPSALSTFPVHLVDLLMETLKTYLPNVTDPAARESLLMQVLYAAGSLGRLGADFSMMIALLEEDIDDEAEPEDKIGGESATTKEESESKADDGQDEIKRPEWVRIIEKHRVQAARLEALAAGQEQMGGRKGSEVAVR